MLIVGSFTANAYEPGHPSDARNNFFRTQLFAVSIRKCYDAPLRFHCKLDARRMDALSPQNSSSVDRELLARVAKGNQEAFARLYEQTSSLLYTLVLRIVRNPGDAADLLQEVYLEAWRKASNYDPARGAPMAWLVTLARSRAIDWVRALASRGRDVTASLDDTPASDLVSRDMDALDISAANERHALVQASLKALPPVQQQVIELAFYQGLTHVEISERLHVPLGTIKTRIRLAMDKLRDGLKPLWEEKLGIPD